MFGPFNSIFEYFLRPKIYQIRKILSQNIFRLDNFVDPKFFWIQIFFDQNYFYPKFFPSQNFFCPKICLPIFLLSHFLWLKMFWPKFFGPQIFFGPKYFWLIFFNQNFFDPISFLTQKSFDPNYLSIQKFSYPNFFLIKNVFDHFFLLMIYLTPNSSTEILFGPSENKFFWTRIFLDKILFWPKIILYQNHQQLITPINLVTQLLHKHGFEPLLDQIIIFWLIPWSNLRKKFILIKILEYIQ